MTSSLEAIPQVAVDDLGRLCIDTDSGPETVSAGDVKLLRPTG